MYWIVNKIISDFSDESRELSNSVNTVKKIVSGIAKANEEEASGNCKIAEKMLEISNKSNNVGIQAEKAEQSAERLTKLITKFKV